MRRIVIAGAASVAVILLIVWAASPGSGSGTGGAPPTTDAPFAHPAAYRGDGLDLRTLLLTRGTKSQEYLLAVDVFRQTGIPFHTVDVADLEGSGVAAADDLVELLVHRPGYARFNSVVITTADLSPGARPEAEGPQLPDAHAEALRSFQAEFGVRSVTLNSFPQTSNGLRYDGYLDALTTPVEAQVSEPGRQAFPNIAPSGVVPLVRSGVYLSTPLDSTTTPLLTVPGPDGRDHPVVAVRTADGIEQMSIMVGNGPELVHSLVLSHGWLEWVTRGVHLGRRVPTLTVHVDDLFLTVGLWDVDANAVGDGTFRNSGADIEALVAWLDRRRSLPSTATLGIDLAFVGSGADDERYPGDSLLPAVLANRDRFRFINHTYSHYDMDCGAVASCGGEFGATAARIERDIRRNVERGDELGLESDWDTMVQPNVSGVNGTPGSTAQRAAVEAGIRFWISDTSRPGGDNPSFNTGIVGPDDSRLYIVPRHPTNLFYDNSTPEELVDEYNHVYAPGGTGCATTRCHDAPLTYEQIVDEESDRLVLYLLRGDTSPLMFHTPNTRRFEGDRSLLTDLLDATLAKYDALLGRAIESPSFRDVARSQQRRAAYDAADVAATVRPCEAVIVRAGRAATVPLTGADATTVRLDAGQTVTVDDAAC